MSADRQEIRVVMGKWENIYRLEDMVKYDEAFVGKAVKNRIKSKLKRGREGQKQSKVAVMAESTEMEDPDSAKH